MLDTSTTWKTKSPAHLDNTQRLLKRSIKNEQPFANWSANVRVFIAQMVEHCSANAEAMGSSPFFFFGFICHCLNCNYHSDDDVFI